MSFAWDVLLCMMKDLVYWKNTQSSLIAAYRSYEFCNGNILLKFIQAEFAVEKQALQSRYPMDDVAEDDAATWQRTT